MKDLFEKSMVSMEQRFDNRTSTLEQKFDDKFEDVKRYTGVLVEDLRKDVKAIAEGHDILNARMDGLEKNMAIVKDYIIGVDAKLNEHEIILKRVK